MKKVERKLEKLKKSTHAAEKSLLKMVNKGGNKKGILKKVSEIRSLNKDHKKLVKKLEIHITNGKSPKPESVESGMKLADKKASYPIKKVLSKMKNNLPTLENQNGELVEKNTEVITSDISTELSPKDAIKKINSMTSVEELKLFIASEKRKAVLSKAHLRIKSLA